MKNRTHWLVLLAMCGLSASSVGILINSVGVFYSPVSEELGILRGTFALHVTISTFVCALVSLLVPKILTGKNLKTVITFCVVLSSISTILMAGSTQMWQFIVLGILRGIGNAFFGMVAITMIVNNWFIKFHGFATSLALSFGGVSGAVCSPALTSVIENYGWNIGFIAMGILIIIFCLPFILLPVTLKPEDQELSPYGCMKENKEDFLAQNTNHVSLCSFPFIALFLFCFLLTSITSITQHFPGFTQSIQVGVQTGSFMISACMFGNIISKLLIGILSDKIGPFKSVIVMMAINAAACILLISTTSVPLLLVGAFLFGFIYSVSAVGMVVLTRASFGDERYNKVYPIISFAGNVGSALSVSCVGYLYDFTNTYITAFLLALFFEALNLIMLMVLYTNRGKQGCKIKRFLKR